MKSYGIYNVASGIFSQVCFTSEVLIQSLVNSGEDYMEVDEDFNSERYYLSGGSIVPRPKMSLTFGKRTIIARELTTISGIPTGATVAVFGDFEDVCNDGEVTFDLDIGIHIAYISLLPYRPVEVTYYVSAD